MNDRRALLRRLAPGSATQPATLLWRAFEAEAFLRHGALAGRGLDLGCGDGVFTSVLAGWLARSPSLVGVEPAPRDCELARRTSVYERVHCAPGDAVPEADATMDFVLANNVLEHVADLQAVLREVVRLLRDGGRLVFAVPSEQFHACLAGGRLVGALARLRGSDYHTRLDLRMSHVRYLALDEWTAELERAGLRVEAAHRYMPARAVRVWERLSNATGGIAFELFGGRRGTLDVRHDLGLARRLPTWVAAAVARFVEVVAGDALDAEIDPDGPSGGLLVIATR